jgi:hypothetical protein
VLVGHCHDQLLQLLLPELCVRANRGASRNSPPRPPRSRRRPRCKPRFSHKLPSLALPHPREMFRRYSCPSTPWPRAFAV